MSTNKITGKGPLYVGTNEVSHMANWSLTMTVNTNKFAPLGGDGWNETDYGIKSCTGTASGVRASNDTNGQDLVKAAFDNQTKLTNLKLYTAYSATPGDALSYWQPVSGANGFLITSFSAKKDGQTNITTLDIAFESDGAVEEVITTVPT